MRERSICEALKGTKNKHHYESMVEKSLRVMTLSLRVTGLKEEISISIYNELNDWKISIPMSFVFSLRAIEINWIFLLFQKQSI